MLATVKTIALQMTEVSRRMADPMNQTRFKSVEHEKLAERIIRNRFYYLVDQRRKALMETEQRRIMAHRLKIVERKNRVSKK